jgi:hypothetical protein
MVMHGSISVREGIVFREPNMMGVGFCITVDGSTAPATQLGLTTF